MTMPSTPEGLLLVIGAIFLSIGILGGGFELSAIKIPQVGNYSRMGAFITGVVFIGIALKSNLVQPHESPVQSPSPAATERASPQPPDSPAFSVISAVSPILPQPNQTITIAGSGFGSQSPYDGDSRFIMITDVTRDWNAGRTGDLVALSIASWTDTQIVIQGFIGDYGRNNWTLINGDQVVVKVWNPLTGAGPSTCVKIVGSTSSRCGESG